MRDYYFFELPVYRLPEDQYNAELHQHLQVSRMPAAPGFDEYHFKDFGGAWRFNEIVGFIRLYFLGWQVRGEYFAVDAKRVVKTRKKLFVFKTPKLAPEVNMLHPTTSDAILAYVRKYIERCKEELPRRVVDDAMFEALAPHMNWLSLYGSSLPVTASDRPTP